MNKQTYRNTEDYKKKAVKWNAQYRLSHPDKRNIERKRYYDKHRLNAYNGRKKYTPEEIRMILAHAIPDVELGKLLGRSVQALQIARSNYLKKNYVKVHELKICSSCGRDESNATPFCNL